MTTITTNAYTKVIKDWTTKSGLRAVILLVRGSHHCGYVEVPEQEPRNTLHLKVLHSKSYERKST